MLPKIGSSGIFTLSAPFDTLVVPGVEYTCESIRRFGELVEAGVEPYEEYYEPQKIERATYEQDVENNVAIVRLRSTQNAWIDVPDSYVLTVPNTNGFPYHAALLSVDLGVIPTNLDMTSLKDTIRQVVQDYLGVQDSEVNEVAVSDVILVSAPDHDRLEAARKAMITVKESDRSKAIRLTEVNEAQRLKILELETYILSLPP